MYRTYTVVVCLALSTLVGCSFKKLGYDHADWLAYREADGFFDITSAQKDEIRPKIDTLVTWIKRERVPEAMRLLQQFKKNAADGLTPEEFDSLSQSLTAMRVEILSRVVEEGAPFLLSLSAEQLKYLEEKLEDANKGLKKLTEADAEDFKDELDDDSEEAVDNFEQIAGNLTNAQKDQIYKNRNEPQSYFVRALAGRRSTQKRFVELLRSRPDLATLKSTLLSWVQNPETMGNEDYKMHRQERSKKFRAMVLAFDRSLSAEQRQHALKELSEKIEEWESITGVSVMTSYENSPPSELNTNG